MIKALLATTVIMYTGTGDVKTTEYQHFDSFAECSAEMDGMDFLMGLAGAEKFQDWTGTNYAGHTSRNTYYQLVNDEVNMTIGQFCTTEVPE